MNNIEISLPGGITVKCDEMTAVRLLRDYTRKGQQYKDISIVDGVNPKREYKHKDKRTLRKKFLTNIWNQEELEHIHGLVLAGAKIKQVQDDKFILKRHPKGSIASVYYSFSGKRTNGVGKKTKSIIEELKAKDKPNTFGWPRTN